MPDLITARAAASAPAPMLPPALRENLVRGLRATIRRDEYRLEVLTSTRAKGAPAPRGASMLLERLAQLRTDLAELEAL